MGKIVFLLLLIAQFKAANACDCDGIIGLKDAKTIFKGTVLSISRIDSPFIRYEIIFKVNNKIKGRIKTRLMVVNISCLLEMCCGISFKEGDTYIVYTYMQRELLYTGLCTKSLKL